MADPAHHQLWRSSNRLGKSYHMAAAKAKEAVEKPGYRGRWVAPTRAQGRAVGQRYLAHFLQRYLDPRSSYSEGTGFNRNGVILLGNGSIIENKSLEDPPSSHEGDEFDRVSFDEPPKIAHLNANTGRTGPGREGRIRIGATMVNRGVMELQRLRRVVEGPEEIPETGPGRFVMPTGWVQYVAEWKRENVPWLTDEQFERQLQKWTGTLEEPQRLRGAWEGAAAARALSFFTRDHIIDDAADRELRKWPMYVLGIDHGKGMGKQVATLIGVDPRRREFYIMREWVGAGSDSPDVDATGILAMLREVGVSPHLVRYGRGDIGAGGESQAGILGESRNRWIMAQVAAQLNLQRCPFLIEVPNKSAGVWRLGEIALNHAFKAGRIHVYHGCHRFIQCAMTYQGSTQRADRDRKDGIDPVRYGIEDFLIEERGGEWVPMFVR